MYCPALARPVDPGPKCEPMSMQGGGAKKGVVVLSSLSQRQRYSLRSHRAAKPCHGVISCNGQQVTHLFARCSSTPWALAAARGGGHSSCSLSVSDRLVVPPSAGTTRAAAQLLLRG